MQKSNLWGLPEEPISDVDHQDVLVTSFLKELAEREAEFPRLAHGLELEIDGFLTGRSDGSRVEPSLRPLEQAKQRPSMYLSAAKLARDTSVSGLALLSSSQHGRDKQPEIVKALRRVNAMTRQNKTSTRLKEAKAAVRKAQSPPPMFRRALLHQFDAPLDGVLLPPLRLPGRHDDTLRSRSAPKKAVGATAASAAAAGGGGDVDERALRVQQHHEERVRALRETTEGQRMARLRLVARDRIEEFVEVRSRSLFSFLCHCHCRLSHRLFYRRLKRMILLLRRRRPARACSGWRKCCRATRTRARRSCRTKTRPTHRRSWRSRGRSSGISLRGAIRCDCALLLDRNSTLLLAFVLFCLFVGDSCLILFAYLEKVHVYSREKIILFIT